MNFVLLALFTSLCLVNSLPFKGSMAPPASTMIIIQGGDVYSPAYLGRRDIILSGSEIVGVVSPLNSEQLDALLSLGIGINVYNVSGLKIVPGFIDCHVHLTGGGGELGPESRTPEAQLSELITAGLTTAVGVLGTDSVSRSVENLLTKTKAFNNDGITAYMMTGAYRIPPPLLTQSVMDDIVLINEVIGIGEVAISDHRSSVPSFDELVRIASDCRIASLLSKKGGIMHVHVGSGATRLQPLWDIVEKSEVPITQFHPTHLTSRSFELFIDAMEWVKAGGWVDFTAEDSTEDNTVVAALLQFKAEGLPLNHVTLSSDAYGSFPKFDEQGNPISYGVGKPDTLLFMVKTMVTQYGWTLEETVSLITKNVATIYHFPKKGQIQAGFDGDLVLLDSEWKPTYVFAKGKEVMTPGWVKKGMFEA